ncbi:MAG: hypothetical protein ACREFW_11380 [Rhizomicrobium sp.]
MRIAFVAVAALISAGSGAAFAQTMNFQGTVNEVTSAQQARGRAVIERAGYKPTVLEFGQAGNLFFTAARNSDMYEATVTPDGRVYFSTGLPAMPANAS